MHKFLVIQTSFIGDVVLATAVLEKLYAFYPDAKIDFLLRKGNEDLLKNHPFLRQVLIWDKGRNKRWNLMRMALKVRSEGYSHVINLHRFGTSGFLTFFSGARHKIGFDKNPFSFCYTHKVKHCISEPYAPNPVHETQRNQELIQPFTDAFPAYPRLYPGAEDFKKVSALKERPYICIAPASVWFTKQFPVQQWARLIDRLPADMRIYLLGGPGDQELARTLQRDTLHRGVQILCGALNYLESAALMQEAQMNYVNDSAPLHFASAVGARVTAVFCSTVPAFGFGPVSSEARIVEIEERLYCRPCGLHGHKACPEGHLRCALDIKTEQLLWWTSKTI